MALRLTAGKWRGRELKSLSGQGTRPTSSRLREAIFSILGQDCSDWKVLDIYAGTGSVGFEALSRGAQEIWLNESHFKAFQILRQNSQLFQDSKIVLNKGKAEEYAKHLLSKDEKFDFVFIDPPFVKEYPDPKLWFDLVKEGGVLMFQYPSRLRLPWPSSPDFDRRYGESAIAIFYI